MEWMMMMSKERELLFRWGDIDAPWQSFYIARLIEKAHGIGGEE